MDEEEENMGLQVHEIISFLCGMVVFVYCLITFFIQAKTRKRRFAQKAREQGNWTKGRYVESKIRSGHSDEPPGSNLWYTRYYVVYEYWVEGKRYTKKLVFLDKSGTKLPYPHEVTLYYDPRRPSKAYSEGETSVDSQRPMGCLLTIVFTGITINVVSRIILKILEPL